MAGLPDHICRNCVTHIELYNGGEALLTSLVKPKKQQQALDHVFQKHMHSKAENN